MTCSASKSRALRSHEGQGDAFVVEVQALGRFRVLGLGGQGLGLRLLKGSGFGGIR